MWFKGFIVAALAASLTVGPFAGLRAYADPPEAVNWEKVAADIAAVPGIDQLPQVWAQAKTEITDQIELLLDGEDCGEGCRLGQLGTELDAFYLAVFGRARQAGEYGFAISSELELAMTVTTTSKSGEPLSLVKVTDMESWDFTDQVVKDSFDLNNYQFVTATHSRMDRVILAVEGPSGARLVDAVLLYAPADTGSSAITLLPLSSVPVDSGQVPPTIMVSLTWWDWACAFSGILWAGTTAVCLASAAGCPGGCVPCCLLFGKTCCASVAQGINVLGSCFGINSPGLIIVSGILTSVCLYVP
jgi:hypothetical protein